MVNINLISARRAERLRLTRIARGLVGATIVSAAIGLFTFAYFTTGIVINNSKIAQQQAQLTKLKPVLDEIKKAELERNLLQPKLTTLMQAQVKTKRWWETLEGLKRAIPDETWLTNYSVEGAEDAQTVRLTGVTSTLERAGETMMRLNAQPEFYSKVELKFTQANRADEDNPSIEFELAAELVNPEADAEKKEGEGDAAKAN